MTVLAYLTVNQRTRCNTVLSCRTRTYGQTAIKIKVPNAQLNNFSRTQLFNNETSEWPNIVGGNFFFGESEKEVVGRKKTTQNSQKTPPKEKKANNENITNTKPIDFGSGCCSWPYVCPKKWQRQIRQEYNCGCWRKTATESYQHWYAWVALDPVTKEKWGRKKLRGAYTARTKSCPFVIDDLKWQRVRWVKNFLKKSPQKSTIILKKFDGHRKKLVNFWRL